MSPRVAVVGGGLSGLLAARALSPDHEVTLFEAGPALGGAIGVVRLAGVLTDSGAESFAVARPEARLLIDELQLGDRVVAPTRSDAHLWRDDGLYALPVSLLGVPVDLRSPDVVAIIGTDESERAAGLDAAPMRVPRSGETLGALVRERMGDMVATYILTPVVAGVHAISPDLVEAEAVIPGIGAAMVREGSLSGAARALRAGGERPGAAVNGLDGGMSTLVRALERELSGVRVHTNTGVERVVQDGRSWVVTSSVERVEVDFVVLAVPAPVAASILDVQSVAAPLSSIRVGDVAVVSLVVDCAGLDDAPVGSGVLVDPDQSLVRAKALTHATAKWAWLAREFGPGRHLLRLSYGRDGVVAEPMDTLVEQAVRDASLIAQVRLGEPVDARVTRWPNSLVHARSGHGELAARVADAVADVPGLAVIGAGLGGNGIAGTVRRASTVGAQLDLMGG